MRKRVSIIMFAATFAVSAFAAELNGDMAYELAGKSRDGILGLTLETSATEPLIAVNIYSEPSHLLLATMIDIDFAQTNEGKEFLEHKALGTMLTKMPGGKARIEVQDLRAADDAMIAVWVLLSDGKYLLVSHAKVSRNEFWISSSLPSEGAASDPH